MGVISDLSFQGHALRQLKKWCCPQVLISTDCAIPSVLAGCTLSHSLGRDCFLVSFLSGLFWQTLILTDPYDKDSYPYDTIRGLDIFLFSFIGEKWQWRQRRFSYLNKWKNGRCMSDTLFLYSVSSPMDSNVF